MLIAAKQQQAQDFMRFWSERRIHRLLIKPAAAGITRLLLESAFARFIELRELHENTDSMEIPHELLAAEEAKQRRWFWPLAGAAVVAVVSAGVYFSGVFTPPEVDDGRAAAVSALDGRSAVSDEPAAPNGAQTDVVPAQTQRSAAAALAEPAAAERIDPYEEELLLALAAESRGDMVEPIGDNALDHYVSILSEAPDHVLALARRDALLEEQFAQAQEQILQHDFDTAEITLAHIARGQPPGTRLQFMREQLLQMRQADADLEVARQVTAERPQPGGPLRGTSPTQPTELQSMLTLTRLRLDEGLLVEPAGDSAHDYLMRALDLGAEGSEIQALARQFSALAVEAVPVALSEGNIGAASTMLETARAFGVQTPELVAFESEVESALLLRARELNDAMHARALVQIDDGVYLGRDDSAIAILNQLRERRADEALVSDLEARLTNALSRSTRAAISANRFDEADALLAAFETASLELPVIRTLERDLGIARRQEQFLVETAAVGEMTLLEAAPAVYPRAAQAAEVTGWVDLRFTVDTTGATTDIEVVGSEPAGQFENAAVAALSRYRFAPFEFEDRPYERRVRLRMRFELD
jgi:protein TonB